MTTTEWPPGVIARAVTVGGATTDVIDDTTNNGPYYGNSVTHRLHGACTGERCPETYTTFAYCFRQGEDPEKDEEFQQAIARIQAWAQQHAKTCRWAPRPHQD